MPISRKCSSTARSFASINTLRAPQKEGAQSIGRSRGGLTTKIHALVEALGNLARWRLSAGQAADVTEAEPLLDGVAAKTVAADKAYDSQALIDTITASGAQAVIPHARQPNSAAHL